MNHTLSVVLLLATFAVSAVPVMAEEFPLRVELSTGKMADFGTVHVEEDGGGLLFDVRINTAVVGNRADLHRLYFNLHQPTTNLTVETLDGADHPYSLRRGRRALGSAGAFFDWSVDFGSGSGSDHVKAKKGKKGKKHKKRGRKGRKGKKGKKGKGNGVLQQARFRIVGGDQPLVIDGILPKSVSRTNVSVQIATHLQEATFDGESISTVGGVFEPGQVNQDTPSSDDPSTTEDPICVPVIDIFTGETLFERCG